jgi:transketolase
MDEIAILKTPEQLRRRAYKIRQRSLRMVHKAGMGHTGGDFSAVDIYTVLYFGDVLNINPSQPDDPNRDRFILGHGLPIACGAALASKLDKKTWRTFVMTGDGELQEGSNWEAAMMASHYKLDNLTLIVDRNRLQQGDTTESTITLEPLSDKWRAFGWAVQEVNGHNHAELLGIFNHLPFERNKPNCIIAHTHKGMGLSAIQDKPRSHHYVPANENELAQGLAELEEAIS